tara:strand:- start:1305 stop:1607 length:303 start_codon:yes stop_codon:yes gene_type:complete
MVGIKKPNHSGIPNKNRIKTIINQTNCPTIAKRVLAVVFLNTNIMKYFSILLITGWACFMLFTNPDLKPSDNYVLFILSILSMMYSIVSILILILEARRK